MKKTILVGVLATVMLAATLTAGCVNPLAPSSPSPSPSQTTTSGATQNASQSSLSAYLTDTIRAKNYTVVSRFTAQPNQQTGTIYYNSTVRNANGTYRISYQVMPTVQAAHARYEQIKQSYAAHGYRVTQQRATAWLGNNSTSAKNVGVSYGTSPLMRSYVVTVTEEKVATKQPALQQSAWAQTWNAVHVQASTAGSTMPPATIARIHAQLQERMTGRTTTATTKTK